MASLHILPSLLFLFSLFSFVCGSVQFSSSIHSLTKSNFDGVEGVGRSNKIVLVAFYSQSCGPICTQIINEYNKAAKALSSMLVLASVDCNAEAEICGRYKIDSPPPKPILYSFRHPSPPTLYPHPIENVDAKAIVTFGLSSLPNDFVTQITSDTLPVFLELRKVTTLALYLTDKKPVSSVIKAASYHYGGKISFGEVKHTERKVADLYSSVTGGKFPALVILPFGSHETTVYNGPLDASAYDDIIKYLSQFHSKTIVNAEMNPSGDSTISMAADGGEAPEPTYEDNHPLNEQQLLDRAREPRIPTVTWKSQPWPEDGGLTTDVTPDNYDILLLNRQTPWLVLFYDPNEEETKGLTSILHDFTRAAGRVSNEVRFGLVNVHEHSSLRGTFSVTKTPVIRTIANRPPRSALDTQDYNGELSFTGIQRYISQTLLPQAPVASVNSASLIGFVSSPSFAYNPTINYSNAPRVLFINMDHSVPDLLRALAFEFDGRYVFGISHYTEASLVSQFGVKEVPSLFLITMVDEEDKNKKSKKMKVHPYKGPLYFNALYTFLRQFKP